MKHDKGGPIVDWNRKLMPAVEAASMSYDRRRALRRAAINKAWDANHYSKDELIEIALDAIEHIDTAYRY